VQVGSIASSAREQADGIGQINIAVRQLDQTTQSAAANAEETAAAAEELNAQAEQLRAVVASLQSLVSGKSIATGADGAGGALSDRRLHALADSGGRRLREPQRG